MWSRMFDFDKWGFFKSFFLKKRGLSTMTKIKRKNCFLQSKYIHILTRDGWKSENLEGRAIIEGHLIEQVLLLNLQNRRGPERWLWAIAPCPPWFLRPCKYNGRLSFVNWQWFRLFLWQNGDYAIRIMQMILDQPLE